MVKLVKTSQAHDTRLALALGLIVTCCGLPVLLKLNQLPVFDLWQTMQFNAALCIVLIGTALMTSILEFDRASRLLVSVAALIGGATFFEHASGFDLKIDSLIHSASSSVYENAPGRMALISSVLFVCLSISVFCLKLRPGRKTTVSGLLGGSTAALGFSTIFISRLSAHFDIASISHMSPASGLAFVLAGSFVFSQSLKILRGSDSENFRILPLITTTALSCLVLFSWQYLIKVEEESALASLRSQTSDAQERLVEKFHQTTSAIGRYAARVGLVGVSNKDYLRLDSANYLSQIPTLRRIGITNDEDKVIWSYPEDLDFQVHHLDQANDPLRRQVFHSARLEHKIKTSSVIRLKSGELGVLVAAPIFRKSRFVGSVYATMPIESMFEGFLPEKQFSFDLSEQGKIVFTRASLSPTIKTIKFESDLSTDFTDLKISAKPTESYTDELTPEHPTYLVLLGEAVILIIGLLLERTSKANQERNSYLEREKFAFSRLNLSMASAQIAAFSSNFKTGVSWRSDNHDRIFGYEKQLKDWTPQNYLDRIVITDIAEFERAQTYISLDGEPFVREIRIRRQTDNSIRWIRIATQTTFNEAGDISSFDGVLIDVTDQKQTAIDLKAANERFQRIAESSMEGVWERTLVTNQILYLDDNTRSIFGFEREEDVSYEKITALIENNDKPMISKTIDDHVRQKTRGFEFEFGVHDHRNPLLTKSVRARGQVLNHENGELKLVATLRDISNEVMNRRHLEQAVVKAEEAVRAKAAFLASMSHEIRTPLNGIIGMTDLLLESQLDATQKNFAEIVQKSGESLLRLINDVLDFSKVEAGKLELDDSQFNIASLIESQLDISLAKAKKKNISLAGFVSPELPTLMRGDAGRLGQVLLNLISNAVKFTDSGGVSVTVEKRKDQTTQRDLLSVRVRDTGIGISENALPKLFEPFVQADASISKSHGGTGLGLSICKKIVQAMGGQIGIESLLGVGSVFWFEIPIWQIEIASLRQIVGWEKIVSRRILIAEEDAILREAIQNYAESSKLRYAFAESFAELSRKIRAGASEHDPFELLIVGSLKDGDSLQISERLRESGDNIPSVCVVPFGTSPGSPLMTDAPGRHVISQPIKQSPFLNAVVQALNPELRSSRKNEASHRESDFEQRDSREFRVLIADDVSVNQLMTSKMLEFLGYAHHSVANGLEVLQTLEQSKFDLILMDCQMPEMNGFEATRAIRESKVKWIREIPIIALTANAMSGDDKLCFDAGMNDYLAKPMKKEQLSAKLKIWLNETSADHRAS